MKSRRRIPEEAGIFVILVLVLVAFSLRSDNFATASNSKTLLLNGTVIGFLALGQTFVLLTGGIDLSTGANVALTGMFAAELMSRGFSWIPASLAALALGTLVGVANGLIIHYVKVPPFIVTFAIQGVASSIPLIITHGQSVSVKDINFSFIGQGFVAGVPTPVVMLLITVVIAAFLLHRTVYGRHVYAYGGNRDAARLAGVHLARTTVSVYAISGACAGFGGLIATSRLGTGFPTTGLGNELFFSIAAAVVGGVSLFGGTGSVVGALIGAILIAAVSNGMNVSNVESYWQPLVIGLIILLGVSLDTYRRVLSGRRLPSFLERFRRPGSGRPGEDPGSGATQAAPAGGDTTGTEPVPPPREKSVSTAPE